MMRRLLRGIVANCYGQGVSIAIQLLSIPILIRAWGGERYGLWLILSALPAALSFSDCGVTITSGNAMTAAIGRGDVDEAQRLFAQAVRFIACLVTIVACLGAVLALAVPNWVLPPSQLVSPGTIRITALALLATTLAGLGTTVLDTAFRASGDYAFGSSMVTTIRLVENGGTLLAASAGGEMAAAALAMLALRLSGLALMAWAVHRRVAWASFGQPGLTLRGLQPMLGPAMAALAVPVSLAVSLQGMTLAAGFVLPLALVPVFTATRTVTRAVVQAIGLFTHALMPEMARVTGRRDATAIRALVQLNARMGAVTLGPGWLLLLLFGPASIARWTAGRITIDPLFLAMMATAALCQAVWLSNANLLLAMNRQAEFAYVALAIAVLTALAASLFGHEIGLIGLALASLIGEAFTVVVVLPKCFGGHRRFIESAEALSEAGS